MEVRAIEFQENPLGTLQRIDAATSRLSYVSIEGVPCVYLNDPNLISAVLSDHWADFRKEFGYKKSREYIQKDLFSPDITWPSADDFSRISAELKQIVLVFVNDTEGEIEDLYAWSRRLIMRIFQLTLLHQSVRASCSQQELEDATMRAIDILGREILKFPVNIDCVGELDQESHSYLRSYASKFVQSAGCPVATPARAITTILAGYEQMASIMFWLVVHYADRPLSAMGKTIGGRQFLNEVIRLHSPIWTIMRRPKHDVHILGDTFSRDTVVITSPWLMARNPLYFPKPNQFQPERWNEQIETFAFFPFSHGPQVCKGERFVRSAMYAMLDALSHRVVTTDTSNLEGHLINVSATPKGQCRATISPNRKF